MKKERHSPNVSSRAPGTSSRASGTPSRVSGTSSREQRGISSKPRSPFAQKKDNPNDMLLSTKEANTKKLSILISQLNLTVGAIEENTQKISEVILAHQDRHDLILFPELAITAYPPEDLLFRAHLHARVQNAVNAIAAITKDCHVIVGHPLLTSQGIFNVASVFYQGQIVQQYRKQKLPNQGVFDEKRYFIPGPAEPCVFSLNHYQLGLCICEDIWEEGPVEQVIEAGADVLLCINASPYDYTKYEKRLNLLEKHAKKGLTVVYANLVGGQDNLIFDGQSIVLDGKGLLRMRLPAFIEANQSITLFDNQVSLDIPSLDAIKTTRDADIYAALVLGTRDYVRKNGFPGVLLGLSGGIDSALTLAIAVDALGASQVHAVLMPSRHTADISVLDAQEQARRLGIKTDEISIEPAYQALLSTLSDCFKGHPNDITEENIQARIRGLLLMALSNKTGKMVLTTSNKSEMAVGYSTLYGDMAGGYSVLKDVLKTQVYQLAAYRNSLSAIIPERVIMRAPSAELADNQTDQDSLPPYSLLDAIIQAYVENNLDAEAIIKQGFDSEIVQQTIRRIQNNEHKRRQAAPGPKISPRAFAWDWRYPITNQY